MKGIWAIVIGVFAPLLANAADIEIPAQPLGTALQELAKQSGIQIVVFSKFVEGRSAPELQGTFTPEAALDTLLNGTDLTYRVLNDRAIEVTAKPVAATSATAKPTRPAEAIEEVQINAQLEKLSVMRAEIEKLEDQFYSKYNELNTDHQYDVTCRYEQHTGSHVLSRLCQPDFIAKARDFGVMRPFLDETPVPATKWQILSALPAYQQNMIDMVAKHPELFKLIKERYELEQRYEAARRKKFEGKVFVWD